MGRVDCLVSGREVIGEVGGVGTGIFDGIADVDSEELSWSMEWSGVGGSGDSDCE